MMRFNFSLFGLILALAMLAGCWSNPIKRLSPYQAEIQQGNVVTQDMMSKLKPGMTPSQVRYILGTPLLVDPFRQGRWDYVYTLSKGDKQLEQRRVTVVFENERLKAIEGDVVAAKETPQ